MSRSSRASLVDQRDFLVRSIDDLDAEISTGALDADDHAALLEHYAERLGAVEAELAALDAAATDVDESAPEAARPAAAPWRRRLGSRRARRLLGWSAAGCFAVAAVLLVSAFAGLRLPGEGVSGTSTVSAQQQLDETLAQAAIVGSEGNVSEAVRLYDQVLATDPNEPVALTYGGWLVRLAGLSKRDAIVVAAGDSSIAKAVRVAPSYPDAHALYGVALLADRGAAKDAAAQFRLALADHPTRALVASVAPYAKRAFADAHERLPSAFRHKPAADSTTR